jgi:hypothetical protein
VLLLLTDLILDLAIKQQQQLRRRASRKVVACYSRHYSKHNNQFNVGDYAGEVRPMQ